MDKKRIFLSSPTMTGAEQEYIKEAFDTNWVAPLGKNVNEFEKELASYVGVSYAAALISGTAAIHMAIKALGISRGDVVFCSSLTFAASCNPIVYEGGIPVFIDSEEDSWNMDPNALRKAFEKYPNVKAVIVVNLYGTPAKLDEIVTICNEHNVPLIEDAAESLGATYKGKYTGTYGKYGVFSFNGNKIITTSGGGMLLSDDTEALEKALFWATQARDKAPWYQHSEMGYNYRMSNIVAGIGRGQLTVLEERVKARREVFERYKEALGDIPGVGFMPEASYGQANRWLTVMTLDSTQTSTTPMQIIEALEAENIEARPVWKPMHLQPLFAGCMYFIHEDDVSISDQLFARGVCLPSGSNLSLDDQQRVIQVIKHELVGD